MKKINKILILLTFTLSTVNIFSACEAPSNNDVEEILKLKDNNNGLKNILISFKYENEKLVNIINQLAAYQGINILLPKDPDKIDINVSVSRPNKISLAEGWSIVNTFLDIAGYSIMPNGITHEITKNKTNNSEALPTYINIHPEQLPSSNEKVRYLYYMQNINLGSPSSKSKANIESILKDMLSGIPSTSNYVIDPKSNCIIISNKTSNIKAVMGIIIALDQEGFREAIEIVPLVHASPKTIYNILSEIIQNKPNTVSSFGGFGRPYGSSSKNKDEDSYFSKNTSIVAIERSGSIAIMGEIDSVKKVKDFIIKYLDVPVDSNKSIIHIKELQYHNADKEFVRVLNKVIKSKSRRMQSSSQKDPFNDVIIAAEGDGKSSQIEQLEVKSDGKQSNKKNDSLSHANSNNLIIAARDPEWKAIEQLIDELDQPELQIAIEALIVDLNISDTGKLAAQTRNLSISGNPKGINFQSAQIGNPVLNFSSGTPTSDGLASNLLTAGTSADTSNNISGTLTNLSGLSSGGSTLISFDDGNGIASLLQVMQQYSNAKVLSQPFVTTTNHQQAAISLSTERIVDGTVKQQSVGGPSIIKNETIKADLKVDILPRISKSGDNINLEIIVHASEFKSEKVTDNTILSRIIKTNANVSNKQVLVIGGLTKVKNTTTKTGIPVLSKIPILGNIFKGRSQTTSKSTLMVFISPKIIQPRAGISKFAEKKLSDIKDQISLSELAFDNLSDPITRILFPAQSTSENSTIDSFASKEVFEESAKNSGPISGCIS